MPRFVIDPKYSFNTETRSVENSRTELSIPHDEPRILFRARDISTVRMLESYRSECVRQGCTVLHLQSIDERIAEFRMWQRAHANQVKKPD